MDNLKNFLESDFSSARDNSDFTGLVEANVNNVLNRCAEDTEFPLAEKEWDHANFGWFANCVSNSVFVHPVLNQNRSARAHVTNSQY